MEPALAPSRHPVVVAVESARAAVETAMAGKVWSACDDEVLDAIVAAEALRRQTDALFFALTRETDLRDLRKKFGFLDLKAFLRRRLGIGPHKARQVVTFTETLTTNPRIREALERGALSVDHAEVIVAAMAELPETTTPQERDDAEIQLIGFARDLDPSEVRICGAQLRQRLTRLPDVDDPKEAADVEAEANASAARAFERRGVTSRRHRSGLRAITFLVDDEGHASLFAALDPLAKLLPEADGLRDERTLPQRRADALLELVSVALASDALPMTGGGVKPQVVVTIDWETLLGERYRAALLDDGSTLSPSALRRLLCDADILPATMRDDSQVLDLGRSARLHSIAQRRALGLRDRGCVFLGCDRVAARCQAHHMRSWSKSGVTSVDNGALLCDYHHRRVHREGWEVRRG